MKKSAYGTPLLLHDGSTQAFEKVDPPSELFIQQTVFECPDLLPFSDIDESFNPCLPICTELRTPAGFLDILLVTPDGELCIVEAKLWRNPQARREVIAQILDYAKELAAWTYEDLQREVSRKLDAKGNVLYDMLAEKFPDKVPSEADFVDAVSRNLRRGKFLLLIVGDGIKEGAHRIVEFFTNVGHLNFTFSMVELSVYQHATLGTLILPKTIVKTVEIQRVHITIPDQLNISYHENGDKPEPVAEKSNSSTSAHPFYRKFWGELIAELTFDDPGQPMPNLANAQNLFVYPEPTKSAWISAYFSKSSSRVGVYMRIKNDPYGTELSDALLEDLERIQEELGPEVRIDEWHGNLDVGVRMPCDDVLAEKNRAAIKTFFLTWLNKFTNTFRPRLLRVE
ncbi:uncharacterized protein DUF4268 [Neolewinella xylanilytica]|uniref:Uncharacterized protein DUF4268 n=1 Tax=Neolewinella xylanilytica TaxID=1514080 RepID=A0A2S6I8S7_9BACT|nr:DUF4268 domain-containing protein [Neolewinella xylanilytica]PPK87882.1 uncharacterized protein DUF4268 [Neolewinella xylanilytica]